MLVSGGIIVYINDHIKNQDHKLPDSKSTSLTLEGFRILDQFGQLMVVERVRGLLHYITE